MPNRVLMQAWESDSRYPNGPRIPTSGTAAALTIGTLSPVSGAAAGGTVVTVPGTNMYNIKSVNIGGNDVLTWSWTSDTGLSITTPAHAAGAVSLIITQNDGTATTKATAYTYV